MRIDEILRFVKKDPRSVKWVLPSGKDLQADFSEYKLKEEQKWRRRAGIIGAKFPLFESLEDFESKLKSGKVFTLKEHDWGDIQNLTRTGSIESLKNLVRSYVMPRDVDRIVKGLKSGGPLPLPIVIRGSKGRWIMAGNTRLNAADALGFNAEAVEIDVS